MKKLGLIVGSIALVISMFGVVPAYADTAATVTCKDGSAGKAGKGACSHHGGVDKSAAKASADETPAAPAETKKGKKKASKETEASSDSGEAATVTCKDGSTSTKTGKGACSHHGGVNKSGAAASTDESPAAPAEITKSKKKSTSVSTDSETTSSSTSSGDATGATAKCKDGTYSHAKHHQGACSHHGGVAEFLN